MTKKMWVYLAGLPLVLNVFGCFVPKTVVPIPSRTYFENGPETFVWLPGRRSSINSFIKHQYPQIAEESSNRQPPTLIFVDAHLGYYNDSSLVKRIKKDILATMPGEKVVMAGISMGGLGASVIAKEYPDQVKELLLFSPFLGDESILDRVKSNELEPKTNDGDKTRKILEVWDFLLSERHIAITIYCGTSDRLADGIRLVEDKTEHRVIWVEGDHDWRTWKHMWQEVIASRRN